MSQFNAIGEYGLNDVLTKRLTTPGGSNSPSVAPEIFPVLTLENDRPEWGHLKGETHGALYVTKTAVVGEFSMAQFYLRTNANCVAVITEIENIEGTTLRLSRLVGISGALGGWAGVTTMNRDTREGGNATNLLIETNGNAAAPTRFGTIAQFPASAGYKWNGPLIIGPGGAFGVFCISLNQNLSVNVKWYERPAQPGELA